MDMYGYSRNFHLPGIVSFFSVFSSLSRIGWHHHYGLYSMGTSVAYSSDPAFAVRGMVREHWSITGATMKSLSEITFECDSPEQTGSEALSAKHHATKMYSAGIPWSSIRLNTPNSFRRPTNRQWSRSDDLAGCRGGTASQRSRLGARVVSESFLPWKKSSLPTFFASKISTEY